MVSVRNRIIYHVSFLFGLSLDISDETYNKLTQNSHEIKTLQDPDWLNIYIFIE